MRKLILVAHISLDGFVAGPNGELDGFEKGEENLEFVCKLTEEADAALFGRVSYELLNSYWPTAKDLPGATNCEKAYSNWYNNATKIVVSKTIRKSDSKTSVVTDNLTSEVIKLKQLVGKDILIFGSPSVVQSLIRLIDGYWIFVNPVIFGKGIPLFAGFNDKIKLTQVATVPFSNGEVALHYVPNTNE